jgi:26S proteasome regulatory subunit N10
MGLEATMIIVDNSDWSRNGDYYPTRWESQEEAANLVAQAKCESNPESAVGLMMMAGKQVDVSVTPIQEPGRILASFHGIKLSGKIQLSTALQIAQLALKHRQNKNQKQRIIVFVASPVWEDENTLVTLGKRLKKNGVALDIVNMEASEQEQNQKLQKLVEAADSSENSHYIQVQPGVQLLSDILLSSPILMSGEGGGIGGAGGDFGAGAGSMDPELEMAIRISLEEEKERARKKEEDEKKKQDGGENKDKMQEEKVTAKPAGDVMKDEGQPGDVEDMDEEELMRRAQELSLADHPAVEQKKKEEEALIQDPNFVNELLNSIQGIDQNSDEIKKALEQLKKGDDKKDNK